MSDRFAQITARIVEAWDKLEASASVQQIEVGKLAHQAVRIRLREAPPKSTRAFRAEAIDSMATALGRAGHKVRPSDVNRSIRISQVAALLDPTEAKKVPVRALIALSKLIRRNAKSEEWTLHPKHQEAAKTLWQRIAAGDANPGQVQAEVNTILGGVKSKTPRAKPSPVDRIVSVLEKASADELTAALRAVQLDEPETFRKVLQAFRPLKTQPPPTPTDETKRKSFFGTKAA